MARRIQNTSVFSFCAVAVAAFLLAANAAPSYAQTAFVLGGGLADDCYQAVKRSAPNRSTRATCDRALETEQLSKNDLAATLVNRGITALRVRDGTSALADFNAALGQNPAFSAAFLNRAGAYLLLGRYFEAKVDADTALGIGLKQDEWAAHFNRGIALENLGQIGEAYAAFQRAAALAPSQEAVTTELARFRKITPAM